MVRFGNKRDSDFNSIDEAISAVGSSPENRARIEEAYLDTHPVLLSQKVAEPDKYTDRLSRLRARSVRHTQFTTNFVDKGPDEDDTINATSGYTYRRGYAGPRASRRDRRKAATASIDPEIIEDLDERERLGRMYYLRHPGRAVSESVESIAEGVGAARDWRRRVGEKIKGNPPTQEEIERENAIQAARLGITPEQYQRLNYEKLKENAIAKAWTGGTGYSTRPSGRVGRAASPLSYGGSSVGLGTMGTSRLDMWGRPASVGKGLSARAGFGQMDMFGRQLGPGTEYGMTPFDLYGNPLYDSKGRPLQRRLETWGPAGSGISLENWFRFDNLGGGLSSNNGGELSGFDFRNIGLEGLGDNGGLDGLGISGFNLRRWRL
jgi:hypothetical protein